MLEQAYSLSLTAIFGFAAVVFVLLFFVSAPYSRYQRGGWGPTVAARTAWIVMESPAVFVIALCGLYRNHSLGSVPLFLFLIWQIHYMYRTFVFPFMMSSGSKRFPVLLILFAMVFNTANGYANGYNLFLSGRLYETGWFLDIRFLAGLAAFFIGFIVHVRSDTALRRLRRSSGDDYQIPRGGLFEYISAPNYSGEMFQWLGWALLTWSLAGLAFAVFTIANLLPRAVHHHRWYREHFSDYPQRRRAVIPFLG